MLHERVFQAINFVKDDDFIKEKEFKNFVLKVKQNELSLQMALGDSKEKLVEMVQRL